VNDSSAEKDTWSMNNDHLILISVFKIADEKHSVVVSCCHSCYLIKKNNYLGRLIHC